MKVGHYKVIFLGLAVAGPEEEVRLMKGLQKKFNLTQERAERLLQRVPVVVKKGTSKEEMEKYIRAFEEIGGKVRLEEEERPLEAEETPPAPEPRREPYTGKMITCPQCGFEQPETDECIKCGLIISKYPKYQEMASSFKDQAQKAFAKAEPYPPWEESEGFFSAFLKALKGSLFSSTDFFRKNAVGKGYWSPLIYGVICGVIGSGANLLWGWYFWINVSRYFPIWKLPFNQSAIYNTILIYNIILLPFKIAFFILLYSAITHLCLIIVGGNKNGFRTTFRVVSYAFSGSLFRIVPIVGFIVGWIYSLVLAIIGVREGHNISAGRAILGVLLPIIVIVALTVIAVIFIPLFFMGSMKFLGGVGV